MFDPEQYQLVDFGDGMKIERFGGSLIARESPSVEMFDPKSSIDEFEVDASYDSRDGESCDWHGDAEDGWQVVHGSSK